MSALIVPLSSGCICTASKHLLENVDTLVKKKTQVEVGSDLTKKKKNPAHHSIQMETVDNDDSTPHQKCSPHNKN